MCDEFLKNKNMEHYHKYNKIKLKLNKQTMKYLKIHHDKYINIHNKKN